MIKNENKQTTIGNTNVTCNTDYLNDSNNSNDTNSRVRLSSRFDCYAIATLTGEWIRNGIIKDYSNGNASWLSAFFLQIKGSIAFDKEKQVKSKMEINYQENKVQQKQELFDLETKRKIKDSNKPNLFV